MFVNSLTSYTAIQRQGTYQHHDFDITSDGKWKSNFSATAPRRSGEEFRSGLDRRSEKGCAMTEFLQHGRIRLALHCLRPALQPEAHPLLLLHGLGESHAAHCAFTSDGWPGPVYALDFTGHGASSIPAGGGYTCEVLMGDVDIALAHIGAATVCGRGLGAYIALLIAGARPDLVRGAILLDGPGMAGACSTSTPYIPLVDATRPPPPDPFAIAELATDARPPDYAVHFARLASAHSPLAQPIAVCTREQPPWLRAVIDFLGCQSTTPADAMRAYAAPALQTATS
jgi:pimeloyl-ACP methyl ester carboxylesterase